MRIPWIFGGFLFLVIQLSVAKLDENILGAQGSELLKELKESGVLDSFEQELEKMLHQEKIKNEEGDDTNEIKVNEKPKKEEENNEAVVEFIQSYVEEKSLPLDQRILDHLATLPVPENKLTKHMVHLSQVLDVIFEIAIRDDPELDQKVLEVIKRVQSLPVMKTSLNKLVDNPKPEVKKEAPKPKKSKLTEPPVSDNDVDLSVVNMAKDFILKLKQKPDFIFELLLPTLVDYGVVSKETTGIMKMYGASFVKSESFANMLDSLAEFIEYFGKSKSGQRMVLLLPEILAADSSDAIMGIFQREAEASWSEFIGRLDNSDIADQLNNQLATACVQYWNYLNQLLKDDMKMALANTFLISQGLPSIKPKKITESVFNLVDKSIKSFTTFKIDLQEARDETLKQFATIEKEYVTSKEFAKLTEKEQVTLVSRFLSENLLEPLQFIWRAHTHINGHQDGKKCAESILCHLNAHMRDQGQIKMTITKMISLAASYGWSADTKNNLDRWKLYQAIWNGNRPETMCAMQYTPKDLEKSCHIFPWQEDVMSLNFEHTEL